MSFSNTGLQWTPSGLQSYLSTLPPPKWANSITLHHTGVPSLAQRPHGFTGQHLENLRHFYQVKQKWSAGPHFFIDHNWIWGMTPPDVYGVHAVSFNKRSIGIEVLGNYNLESPFGGRGLHAWELAAQTTKVLAEWLQIPIQFSSILFHRDDPRTRKTCPGTKVDKEWFLDLVEKAEQ